MLEAYLKAPTSNFHSLVNNTKLLSLSKDQALKYLMLINNLYPAYSTLCNYDLIDYPKLIYIEDIFKDNEEIMSLIKIIKQQISKSYVYKHKYIKRLSNEIPKESFDQFYDEYLVKTLELKEG